MLRCNSYLLLLSLLISVNFTGANSVLAQAETNPPNATKTQSANLSENDDWLDAYLVAELEYTQAQIDEFNTLIPASQ